MLYTEGANTGVHHTQNIHNFQSKFKKNWP